MHGCWVIMGLGGGGPDDLALSTDKARILKRANLILPVRAVSKILKRANLILPVKIPYKEYVQRPNISPKPVELNENVCSTIRFEIRRDVASFRAF